MRAAAPAIRAAAPAMRAAVPAMRAAVPAMCAAAWVRAVLMQPQVSLPQRCAPAMLAALVGIHRGQTRPRSDARSCLTARSCLATCYADGRWAGMAAARFAQRCRVSMWQPSVARAPPERSEEWAACCSPAKGAVPRFCRPAKDAALCVWQPSAAHSRPHDACRNLRAVQNGLHVAAQRYAQQRGGSEDMKQLGWAMAQLGCAGRRGYAISQAGRSAGCRLGRSAGCWHWGGRAFGAV